MKKLLPLLLAFLFFSCASGKFESDFSPVYVTNTSKYAILPTGAMHGSLDALQKMTAQFGKDNSFDFDVYVISDSTQLSMTILNEFGTTMASLFYDGTALDFDSAIFPKNLKAEYIVADFQFCLYEEEDLKSALSLIGVDFEVSTENGANGTIETRTLTKKGKPISKITRTFANESKDLQGLKSIHYENSLRGYSYILNGVEQ